MSTTNQIESYGARAATAPGITPPETSPGKIFIVDDEVAVIDVIQRLLRRAGYSSFKSTNDSTLAFEMIRTTQPDVVLLDIKMPQVSGIEILEQMRNHPLTNRIPVLILTASNNADTKVICLDLGATDFLIKPVDPLELAPRVRNAIQNKHFHDHLKRYSLETERKLRQRIGELERTVNDLQSALARKI